MKILHIDSSFARTNSVSRELTAAIVAQLRAHNPAAAITYRDLATVDTPHASPTALPSLHPAGTARSDLDEPGLTIRDASDAILEEFLQADIVVLGAPMYNFLIPSQLKAWIDHIVVPGTTVRYTLEGPEGLVGSKQVIVAISRGGVYPREATGKFVDFAEDYLSTIFNFIGIDDLKFVVAEGLSMGEETRAKAMTAARASIASLVAA